MTDVYKNIHSVKFFNDYISRDERPDGRTFSEFRNLKLSVDAVHTADSSALVKCGDTSVVCGIKLELAETKAEDPELGFLVTNVELPSLCSPRFKPGPPSDIAQVTSNMVSDIVTNSKVIDLKDLCVVPDKLAWVLYCDMICLDNGGSLVDACLITLMASLMTLQLPTVTYDPETEDIKVDMSVTRKLKLNGLPVPTSFAMYKHEEKCIILVDPTVDEEEACGGIGSNLILCYNNGTLCSSQKFGGSNLSDDCEEKALKLARERAKVIEEVINLAVKRFEETD